MLMPGCTSIKMLLREYSTIAKAQSKTGKCHLLTIKQDCNLCLVLRLAQECTEKIANITMNVEAMKMCLLE